MKVAQTRLHHREARPNVELCRDPAQYQYVLTAVSRSWNCRNSLFGTTFQKKIKNVDINQFKGPVFSTTSFILWSIKCIFFLGGGPKN